MKLKNLEIIPLVINDTVAFINERLNSKFTQGELAMISMVKILVAIVIDNNEEKGALYKLLLGVSLDAYMLALLLGPDGLMELVNTIRDSNEKRGEQP